MFALFSLLFGCGGLGPGASPVELDPGLYPTDPPVAGFAPAGEVAVAGQAPGLVAVTVEGQPALRAGTGYVTTLDLPAGVHLVEVLGVDAEGLQYRERYGFVAGDFAGPGPVADAAQVRLGPSALASVGPLVDQLLDPSALLAGVGGGAPIYEDADFSVYLAGVEVPSLSVDAVPRDGFVDLTLWMPGLTIPLDVQTQLWFIDIDLNANIRMDQAAITGALYLRDDGAGGVDVALRDVVVMVQGVELDIDGLADFFEDMFITDQQAEDLLADNLDPLAQAIPGLVADLLGSLDLDLEMELDLLGTTVGVAPHIAGLAVHPAGVDLAVDLELMVAGESRGPGALTVGRPAGPEGTELSVFLADDAVNHALYELWEGGVLDLELPIEPGSLEATILALFGGNPATGGAVAVSAGLPPVLVERDGRSRLQLAQWHLTVDTPGGSYGEVVEVMLAADLALDLVLDSEAIGAQLSDATIRLEPLGPSAEVLAPEIAQLEQGLGLGIGLANSLLSFPLADLGLEMALPPMEVGRSPDGRAVQLDVELAGWTP